MCGIKLMSSELVLPFVFFLSLSLLFPPFIFARKVPSRSANTTTTTPTPKPPVKCFQCRYIKGTIDPEFCKEPIKDKTSEGVCEGNMTCGKIVGDKELQRKCVDIKTHCARKRGARIYSCSTNLCNLASAFFPLAPFGLPLVLLMWTGLKSSVVCL